MAAKSSRSHAQPAGGSLFLGAVVASGGEETVMAAEFSLLAARVNQLLTRYHEGELSASALAEALADERVADTGGGEWTIGATTGSWYRRTDIMDWAMVPPPASHVVPAVKMVESAAGAGRDVASPMDPMSLLYGPPVTTGEVATRPAAADASLDPSPAAGPDVTDLLSRFMDEPDTEAMRTSHADDSPETITGHHEGSQPSPAWMADVSRDAGWVADTEVDLSAATAVPGVASRTQTPPTPVDPADEIEDPFEMLRSGAPADVPAPVAVPTPEEVDDLLRRWLEPEPPSDN